MSPAERHGGAPAAPYFEDLTVGQSVTTAPALTVTAGHAAAHQAILGGRLRLALDAELSRRVLGSPAQIVHPGLVCDIAIGQSTLLTRRVIGNLFYRGLVLRRAPVVGDTLSTTTEVVALRQNRPRPGRDATGMAVLHVVTHDQDGRAVLDFRRCAMLPLRDPAGVTDQFDELEDGSAPTVSPQLAASVEGWDLGAYREIVGGPHFADLEPGDRWTVEGGDVVSSAPELARLTLNVAFAHHDEEATAMGKRLVYGGHTVGIASAQVTRVLPSLVTIVGWHSCDHLAPVFEGDTLRGEVEVEGVEPLEHGGGLVHLRSRTRVGRDGTEHEVLDWRLAAVMA